MNAEKQSRSDFAAYCAAVFFIVAFLLTNVLGRILTGVAECGGLGGLWLAAGSVGFWREPATVSAAVDAVLAALFLTRFKPFEFFQMKAFVCAGFFGYAAYCAGASGAVFGAVVSAWGCAALLARRWNVWCVFGLGAVAECAVVWLIYINM